MPTERHQRTKRPTTIAAGPYGHPLHPMLIPLPIGAWITSLVFDIASYTAGEAEVFVKASFWLIAVGIVGALAAAVFGLMDLVTIPRGTKAFTTGLTHMVLNLVVVGLFVVGFAIRRGQLDETPVATGPLVLSIVAIALLGISGWLGGHLAYRYGIRVADEETQAEAFQ